MCNLTIWDTSGSQNFDTVRPLSYGEADVFIICYKVSDPLSLYNVKSRWLQEIEKHTSAPLILCGCMADLRDDETTISHLSRLGRSPVTPEQALAIGSQISARHYVETAALVSRTETAELFSVAAAAGREHRRAQWHSEPPPPRPGSVTSHHSAVSAGTGPRGPAIRQSASSQLCGAGAGGSHGSLGLQQGGDTDTSLTRGHVTPLISRHAAGGGSMPSSPVKVAAAEQDTQPVHVRSASQPVRSIPGPAASFSPHSPPPPRPSRSQLAQAVSPPAPAAEDSTPELRANPAGAHLSRKLSFRSSMPLATGKPPLPKSPTELLQLSASAQRTAAITTEPGHGAAARNRLTQLGLPEGKNYESLKSHTSTASHGSTGSKMSHLSSTSSQLSGPRHEAELPDTEDPALLRNLEFISPKAGVYRPVHSAASRAAAAKKDKCSVM